MATNKKSKKGKTIPLTDFLAAEPKLLTLRSNWSEIVDKEEEETKPIGKNIEHARWSIDVVFLFSCQHGYPPNSSTWCSRYWLQYCSEHSSIRRPHCQSIVRNWRWKTQTDLCRLECKNPKIEFIAVHVCRLAQVSPSNARGQSESRCWSGWIRYPWNVHRSSEKIRYGSLWTKNPRERVRQNGLTSQRR